MANLTGHIQGAAVILRAQMPQLRGTRLQEALENHPDLLAARLDSPQEFQGSLVEALDNLKKMGIQ